MLRNREIAWLYRSIAACLFAPLRFLESMTALSVNLNAVAFLRNRRDLPWPNVAEMGRLALSAGAAGLTVHPRPDERHIRRSDLAPLAALVNETPGAEFNMEGYPDQAFLDLVLRHRPTQATFVPDDPAQATSDHGWDVPANKELLTKACALMRAEGIRSALFINAEPEAAVAAWEVGADRVELYTGPYGSCFSNPQAANGELHKLSEAALTANTVGLNQQGVRPPLGVNAGHDLTAENLPALKRAIPFLDEVSIGHGLTAHALRTGYGQAVKDFVEALK